MRENEVQANSRGNNRLGLARVLIFSIGFWALLSATWILAQLVSRQPMTELERMRINDLGDLQLYRDSDAALAPDASRVVFFGDSITYQWDLGTSFGNPSYINRGIRSQTTADMLVRYRQDVIDLHPRAVVILAGVNDLNERNNRGETVKERRIEHIQANDQTMAEIATLHHIQPVFVSILPIHDYTDPGKAIVRAVSSDLIVRQNRWLKGYCERQGYLYIDMYSAMVDNQGKLRRELSEDGIHPNDAGYRIMAKVFSSAFHD